MREYSVPAVATVTDATNLTDAVWANADEVPDLISLKRRKPDGWHEVTAAAFRDEIVAVAKGLVAKGIQPGDRIGLMSRTRYEWALLDYAIWAAGAVGVPIYETSSAEQIAWILHDSGARACFAETDQHNKLVTQVLDQAPGMAHVWQIEPQDPAASAVELLVAAGAEVPDAEVEQRRSSRRADDLATVIYTSGTTGRPKGCMITHRNMATDIANLIPGFPSIFCAGQSTLLFLPLAHAFARLIQVGILQARTTLSHTSDHRRVVEMLVELRPTFLLSAPRVFEKLYDGAHQLAVDAGKGKVFTIAERTAIAYSMAMDTPSGPGALLRLRHAVFDKLVFAKLRGAIGGRCLTAISGGAPLGVRLGHFFRGAGVNIYEGYGLTETSPACAVNLEGQQRIGSVGRPTPSTTIAIAEDSEILVKGDIVFAGYWRNPEATAEAIDTEGWLHTGDLGELDDDGYLTITGRKKEILVTAGGKNVAPAVLEDRVRAHYLVSQCMVLGDRKPFISALVTLDEDALEKWKDRNGLPADLPTTELVGDPKLVEEVESAVRSANLAVSRAESIRQFRILPQDFTEATGELTPSLKVKRSVVMANHADVIASIYGS